MVCYVPASAQGFKKTFRQESLISSLDTHYLSKADANQQASLERWRDDTQSGVYGSEWQRDVILLPANNCGP